MRMGHKPIRFFVGHLLIKINMKLNLLSRAVALSLTMIYSAGFAQNAAVLAPVNSTQSELQPTPTQANMTNSTNASNTVLKSGIDLQWIDNAVKPQHDFFKFTSGKWLASVQIPTDKGRFGAFDELRDLSEQRLQDIITELSKQKNLSESSESKKIADLYTSFMNERLIHKLDIQPLHATFSRIDKVKTKQQLTATFADIGQLGVSLPLTNYVGQDARNAASYALYVNQGGLSLPDRDYYLNEDAKFKAYRDAYLKHVEKMLTMSGTKNAHDIAALILEIETKIAKAQWSKVENRNPVKTYNKIDVAKLPELMPDFSWTPYLKMAGIDKKVDFVIVRQPTYLSALNAIYAETPLKVWQEYIKWRLLDSYAPYLSERFVREDFAFNSVTLRDIPAIQPRWKRGVARVEAALPEALGKIYVEKYFPPENKQRMEQLVNNLTIAYQQSIKNLTWMSAETKTEALAKLAKFTSKIGYPEQWRDYSKLDINKNDLIGNVMRGAQFNAEYQRNKLGKPVDRKEWGMSPQTVNAYYSPRQNEIVFPAAILQPPFFNAAADDAVNYGGIGAVIGHEISHGFDDSGSQSDGDGNLRNWWTKEDKANFNQLTAALVKQYNAYSPLDGYYVNGALTLGENIADNSGLAIAYKAYQLSLGGKPAPVIDGYTGAQRFYIGWAQVWRGKARDAETIRLLNIDPHSPAAARGNVPLTNQPEFYKAFDVKEGDAMYLSPEQRITIW